MQLNINNQMREVPEDQADEPLVWVLRDTLGLVGTRYGCGAGHCGACTVIIDGVATRSCQTKSAEAKGKQITTLEGLAKPLVDGTVQLSAVQQAFLEMPLQCCWCMSGHIMNATALLSKTPNPNAEEIEAQMNQNYCRCGGYGNIRKNVSRAAEIIKNGGKT